MNFFILIKCILISQSWIKVDKGLIVNSLLKLSFKYIEYLFIYYIVYLDFYRDFEIHFIIALPITPFVN